MAARENGGAAARSRTSSPTRVEVISRRDDTGTDTRHSNIHRGLHENTGLGDKQGPEALDADVALAEVLTA
jgi:hypothetical protein